MDKRISVQIRDYNEIVPGIKIAYKDESPLWRHLPGIFRRSSTSLRKMIWLPSEQWVNDDAWRAFSTIAHEFQHAIDRQRTGALVHTVRYCFPQIVGVATVIAAVVSICFGWLYSFVGFTLLTSLFCLPWPSKSRTAIERRGYEMDLAVLFLRRGQITKADSEAVQQMMTSKLYYGMLRKNDASHVVAEMVENVTGPRWPRNLPAFAPTVGAMLELGTVCPKAMAVFRWPSSECGAESCAKEA